MSLWFDSFMQTLCQQIKSAQSDFIQNMHLILITLFNKDIDNHL